jgi:site-specific DNA recombinase
MRSTPATPPRTAAIYARFSTDKQDAQNSIGRQLDACRRWAQANGFTVLEEHIYCDEAMSGASFVTRPALQRLLGFLGGRGPVPFDALLVDDSSRLDRGGKLASLVEMFQARGCKLVSVADGRDLAADEDQLLVHVKAGIDSHYVAEVARRTREGMRRKARSGFHVGGTCYGFRFIREWPESIPADRRERDNATGTRVEVDDYQAGVVRRIFERFIAGQGLRGIASELNAERIPSPRGGTWDLSGIRAMLRNPRYRGEWRWNTTRWRKRSEAFLSEGERARARETGHHPRQRLGRPEGEWETRLDEQLRIVDEATWAAVIARFGSRGPAAVRRGRSQQNPIAALMRCSECGGPMYVETNHRKGNTYQRVFCARRRNRGICGNSMAPEFDRVTTAIYAFLRDQLLRPEYFAEMLDEAQRPAIAAGAGAPSRRQELAALRKDVSRLVGERDNLVRAVAEGAPFESIGVALAGREADLAATRTRLEQLRNPRSARARVTVADVRSTLGDLRAAIASLDPLEARQALSEVLDGIDVLPLKGSWEHGWIVNVRATPLKVLVTQQKVVGNDGSGGPVSSFSVERRFEIPRKRTA